VVDALATDQLITILAEPNLTAQSGEVASFLAGGEFPVPVAASGSGGSNTISIEFKQFGVSLAFIPTVLGPERLNLRVRPEVSELSDNGAISVPLSNGVVKIPALTVRRAETSVELGSGQSFAIAGLLQRSTTINNTGLSGLGDIPVLGALFRSDRFQRNESELVIIITPYLVRPVSDPRGLGLPTDNIRPASDLDRVLHRRQVARGGGAEPSRGSLNAGFVVE
jgi:pilus assembly protein CpaC